MEKREKLKIPYPIIVEGKYDRLRLLSVLDATVLTTEGFGIFRNREKLALFRALARKTPIIVLTDPDGAGTQIRSHISSALPRERIIPLYVPQIPGKEARKKDPSAAGLLGVEGQERARIYELFAPFAPENATEESANGASPAAPAHAEAKKRPITKADLFGDGLTGCEGCTARRAALARRFELPADMTPNALLAALNIIATYDEYRAAVESL